MVSNGVLVLILVGRQCSDSMGSFSFSRAICNHLETYEKHWMFSAAACKEHYIAVSETHNLQEKQNQNVLGYLTYRDISHVSLWIGFGSAGLFPSLFFINHRFHHQQELELDYVLLTIILLQQ